MNIWALGTLMFLALLGVNLWFGPEDETEEELDRRSTVVNFSLVIAALFALLGCFGGSI